LLEYTAVLVAACLPIANGGWVGISIARPAVGNSRARDGGNAWKPHGNTIWIAWLVMLSQGTGKRPGQPLFSRLWGNGYLPSNHQGVLLRPGANPVLCLQNPPGVTGESRRKLLDGLISMNRLEADETGNPEIDTRIAAYEMAFRMQTSVPELTDFSDEPQHILDMYGPDVRRVDIRPESAQIAS
jgi:hypothetical protein